MAKFKALVGQYNQKAPHNETVIFWIQARRGVTQGVLGVTENGILFLSGDYSANLKVNHWPHAEIKDLHIPDSPAFPRLILVLQEKKIEFLVKKENAARFIEARKSIRAGRRVKQRHPAADENRAKSLTVDCPNCHKTFNLKKELAGKKARCSACKTVFVIPPPSPERPTKPAGQSPPESPRAVPPPLPSETESPSPQKPVVHFEKKRPPQIDSQGEKPINKPAGERKIPQREEKSFYGSLVLDIGFLLFLFLTFGLACFLFYKAVTNYLF